VKTPLRRDQDPRSSFGGAQFLRQREQLTYQYYREFNENVFGSVLPADMKIEWYAEVTAFCVFL
jgi:hypothetical protein